MERDKTDLYFQLFPSNKKQQK